MLSDHTGLDRRTAVTNFESLIGRKLALERTYRFWEDPFITADDEWSRDQGRSVVLSWTDRLSATGPFTRWADIAAGEYDGLIDQNAAAVKSFGAPLFLIFDHEPERWVDKDEPKAGTIEDFVSAYQHIHDRFQADGVTNVSYVLTLMATTYTNGGADPYYPGDGYVDFLAADGYNWFGCPTHDGPWRSFENIFDEFYDYGVGKGKEMLVTEYGTGEDSTQPDRKAQWFSDESTTLKGWPEVAGVLYFDSAPDGGCVWWVDSSPQSLDAYVAMGADPYFNPAPPWTPLVVTVSDFRFLPATVSVTQGSLIVWSFIGPSDHSVVDAAGLNLFSSGVLQSGATYSFDFAGSGRYQYRCTVTPSMHGTVKVPLIAPAVGQANVPFTVTISSALAPPGFGFDVQVRKPGSSQYVGWLFGVQGPAGDYTPDLRGTYRFRARLRDVGTSRSTGWSPPAAVIVS
jgi:hypothetical protein